MNILRLISQYGTPIYVYDEQIIIDNYQLICRSIPYENKQIHFAAMCNNHPKILHLLRQNGCSVQINSFNELSVVRQAGFPCNKISYTSTGLSEKMLRRLVEEGIQINLDSVEEVEKYCRINLGGKFGVRIKMREDIELPVDHTNSPKNSDVGIHVEDFGRVIKLAEKNRCSINGIHGYLASNILDPNPFILSSNFMIKCAEHFPDLTYVNFGSGFGVPNKPDEPAFDFAGVGAHYSHVIKQLSKKLKRNIQIKIEPGRSILGVAGTLYTKVTNIKQLSDKKQIAVDAGFGEFSRPNIYDAWHEIQVVEKSKDPQLYDVRGNTALQSDFLGRDRMLPEVKEGDVLIIKNTGAYGFVMASGFPGKKLPPQLLIRSDKSVVLL